MLNSPEAVYLIGWLAQPRRLQQCHHD